MPSHENWFVAELELDNKPLILRGRKNLSGAEAMNTHSKLITITWNYDPDDETGLPPTQLLPLMSAAEHVIFNALEKDDLCIFFAVSVHDGSKQWLAYTHNVDDAYDRLNEALRDQEPYPLEFSAADDPSWEEYAELLENLGTK